MTASLVDHLRPADQARLLWTAYVVLAFSLALLFAGISFARLLVAATLGVLCAAGAILIGSAYLHSFSPLTLGIVGFAIGLIVGAIGFSIVQSVIVGLYCGLITVLVGLNWHVRVVPAPLPASRPASDLLLNIQPPPSGVAAFKQAVIDHLQHLPNTHVTLVSIAAVVVTLGVLLICLTFPRATTIIVTALIGAGTALATGLSIGLVHHWHPAEAVLARPVAGFAIASVLALAGALFQWRIFIRRIDKAKRARPPEPPTGPAVEAAA